MSCEDTRLELALYVRDELDGGVHAEVERHIASCETCGRDLAEIKHTITVIQTQAVALPSHDLRSDVLGALEADRLGPLLGHAVGSRGPEFRQTLLAAVQTEDAEARPLAPVSPLRRIKKHAPRLLAAAAILVAGIVLGSGIAGDGPPAGDVAGAPDMPAGHETQILALDGMGPSTAAVRHYRHDNFRVTLGVSGFAPTPPGKHYAVWVRGPAGDVAIGTFRLKRSDDFEIPFAVGVNPTQYPEFVVTLEPNDGNAALTGRVVSEGRFDPTAVHHGTYDD